MANSSLPERFAVLSLEGPDPPSSPQRTELGFGASAGIIDLNVVPDCGSGVDDPPPPSPQRTELGFSAGAGIFDLNVVPDCGSPQRCAERFDLNVEPSDSDSNDFFVGRWSPVSEPIEFSRARSGDSAGLEVGKIDCDSDSEEQIIAVGDERESDEEALKWMQELVALPLCLDCIELIRREDREWEEIDICIDERELDRERDEAEEDMELNHGLQVLSLGRDSMNARSYFVDDEGEGVADKCQPYEMSSGQFAGDEAAFSEIPSTANSAVESLPPVFLPQEEITEHDVQYNQGIILVGERQGRFPCSHQLRKECIGLWLGVRKRCSLCRHVLPRDNLEYEQWREQRGQ